MNKYSKHRTKIPFFNETRKYISIQQVGIQCINIKNFRYFFNISHLENFVLNYDHYFMKTISLNDTCISCCTKRISVFQILAD